MSEKLLVITGLGSMDSRDAMHRSGQGWEGAWGVLSVFSRSGERAVQRWAERREIFVAKNVVKRGAMVFFTQVIENVAKINMETMSLLPYAA